jgi:hypothetical protein
VAVATQVELAVSIDTGQFQHQAAAAVALLWVQML